MFLLETTLALWTGHPYDMQVWFQTGTWMNQGINIYQPNNHLGYPPLWALWCLVSYRTFLFFGNATATWRLVIKLPIILAQLACAFAVGAFTANRFGKKTAVTVTVVTLTWAFFVYIGAIWGQIDTISALLTFLAFYAIVTKQKLASALLLGFAIALKLYPIVILPAFFIYILKNWNLREAGKYVLYACAVPAIVTFAIFGAYRWDATYFLKTIFYSTPVFTTNPTQINEGCMNFFSFITLQNRTQNILPALRLLWIPSLTGASISWWKKPNMDEIGLTVSIISLYIVFMLTYAWVTEQTFLDVLPFIFILIFAYRPKRVYLYLTLITQILVFIFTIANQTLQVFTPMLQLYWPVGLNGLQNLYLKHAAFIWTLRGTMGLIVSLSLIVLLVFILFPALAEKLENPRRNVNNKVRRKPETQISRS